MNLSVWRMLAAERQSVPVYASVLDFHLTDHEFEELFGNAAEQGCRAFKIKVGHSDIARDLHSLSLLRRGTGSRGRGDDRRQRSVDYPRGKRRNPDIQKKRQKIFFGVPQRAKRAPCLNAGSHCRNSSVSETPARDSVERGVGHVPSPTPIIGTVGDSTSVTLQPEEMRPLCFAAMIAAVSQAGSAAAKNDDPLNRLCHGLSEARKSRGCQSARHPRQGEILI